MQGDATTAYFISDFHLGVNATISSKDRELLVVKFLDKVLQENADLYLLGDTFDFWFEYKHVIPKGNTRFLGKLCELHDAGIKIDLFTGNHDLWMFGYLESEIGLRVHHEPLERVIQGKRVFLAHGDGLGPGDKTFKRIKKIFTSRFAQKFFSFIHPDIGISLARKWSHNSRQSHKDSDIYLGDEREFLTQFALDHAKNSDIDIYIFGHRHLPILKRFDTEKITICNLGDWIKYFTYAKMENGHIELLTFKE